MAQIFVNNINMMHWKAFFLSPCMYYMIAYIIWYK